MNGPSSGQGAASGNNSAGTSAATGTTAATAAVKDDPMDLETQGSVREVGDAAVWSVSSCKPGFGVDQLRDNCLDTYWQSDGPQPHLVNVQFHRKTTIADVCIYADYKSDESYTPSRIAIRVGTHFNDLQEIEVVDLPEPSGWVKIPLSMDSDGKPVRAFMLQIAVLSNHQNGRDTHMRQVRVHAPGVSKTKSISDDMPDFKDPKYLMFLHPR